MFLDIHTSDPLLAARVIHLEHHGLVVKGVGCLDRLLEEEVEAWWAEVLHQSRLEVSDPTGPLTLSLGSKPNKMSIEHWLRTSADSHPVSLRASHRARCE